MSDYYKSCDEMKEYRMVFIGLVSLSGSYLTNKLVQTENYFFQCYNYGVNDDIRSSKEREEP